MSAEYDVVVVGAGPAGAAAALAAGHAGARVLLLDKAGFPRDKPCGDGVAPHTLDVLGELGVTGVEAGFAPVPALRLAGPGGGAVVRPHARAAYTIPARCSTPASSTRRWPPGCRCAAIMCAGWSSARTGWCSTA